MEKPMIIDDKSTISKYFLLMARIIENFNFFDTHYVVNDDA